MADNYLERRMDDYRSGRLKARHHRPAKRQAVFITDGLCQEGEAEVRSHTKKGDTAVAFAGLPRGAGYALAQATGARYYPIDPSHTEALQNAIDNAREHFAPLEMTIITI